MGCANSKLNPEGDIVPPRIRPLLRRRFLELRKRPNAHTSHHGDFSEKKELLLDDAPYEDPDDPSPPRTSLLPTKTSSSPDSSSAASNSKPKPLQEEKLIIAIIVTDSSNDHLKEPAAPDHKDKDHNNTAHDEHGDMKFHKHEDDDEVEETKDLKNRDRCTQQDNQVMREEGNGQAAVTEDEHAKEEADDGRDEQDCEDDDEDGQDDDQERRLCPGSPSFRVYFIEATKNGEENNKQHKTEPMMVDQKEEEVSHKKSESYESVESTASTSTTSNGERKTKKKGRMGRGLRRALRKGGPAAVKNLLNVKSCYHPGCSGHDRARLLSRKADA